MAAEQAMQADGALANNKFHEIVSNKALTRESQIDMLAMAFTDPQLRKDFEPLMKDIESQRDDLGLDIDTAAHEDTLPELISLQSEMDDLDQKGRHITRAVLTANPDNLGQNGAAEKMRIEGMIAAARDAIRTTEEHGNQIAASSTGRGKRYDELLQSCERLTDISNLLISGAIKAGLSAEEAYKRMQGLLRGNEDLSAKRSTLIELKHNNDQFLSDLRDIIKARIAPVSRSLSAEQNEVTAKFNASSTGAHLPAAAGDAEHGPQRSSVRLPHPGSLPNG